MRNSFVAVTVALLSLGAALESAAQAPIPAQKAQRPAPAVAAPPPPQAAPSSASQGQGPGRMGMGGLLDQFTTLDDRDISVLVTSGDETTLSSQMAGKIRKINYGLGDNVAAKAVMLEFDCEEQVAQLESAAAEYRGARETHLTKLRLQALGAKVDRVENRRSR